MSLTELKTERISTGEICLHVKLGGAQNGPPIMFLHGFPEFWYSWRHQINFFIDEGYRVIVPDLRGYNRSDKPADIEDYRVRKLLSDVRGLLDNLRLDNPFLIGHDWGGALTWHLAEEHPDLFKKFVVINVPHPTIFRRYAGNHLSQKIRSWYGYFFQAPVLPELASGFLNCLALRISLTATSNPDTFTDYDLSRYEEAWKQPNALKGMINWYRAAATYPTFPDTNNPFNATLKILWGRQDAFLEPKLAHESAERSTNVTLELFKNNTHWLHNENPETVNRKIKKFISQ